jgi:hypothetical protein
MLIKFHLKKVRGELFSAIHSFVTTSYCDDEIKRCDLTRSLGISDDILVVLSTTQ